MKKIIVLNHKSSLDFKNIKNYPIEINDIIRNDQTVIICPSSVFIPYFKGKYNFKLGSQIISEENVTGSLTAPILKSIDIKYCLIEYSDKSNKKIKVALENGINPIIEIGETFYEYELNKTMNIITKQIKSIFKDIEVGQDIIINYTPKWSYKGKQIPKTDYIQEVVDLIKNFLKNQYDTNIKVIYGGSITTENIKTIDLIDNLDGYLIDDISTDIKALKQFFDILE